MCVVCVLCVYVCVCVVSLYQEIATKLVSTSFSVLCHDCIITWTTDHCSLLLQLSQCRI